MDGRLTLAALLVALLAWFGTLAVVWPTWHGMNHSTGVVAGLADAALHGESPGSARGERFVSGECFPPVPLLTAVLKSTGMSWRAALRWVSLLGSLALLVAVALAGQALGGSGIALTVSLGLLSVSLPFVQSSFAGSVGPWAAALSIGALAAWCHDPRRRGWGAPVLAAAAWLVQPSALTVPLAVLLAAFAPGARRAAGPFTARFAAALAVGLVLTMPWQGPAWSTDVLRTLLFAPPNTGSALRGPFEIMRYLSSFAELAAAGSLAVVYLTGEWSHGRPVRPFGVAALLVALFTMANRGSDHSQLIELTALAAVGAGMWAERATRREAVLGSVLLGMVVLGGAWRHGQNAWNGARPIEARRDQIVAAVRAEPGAVLCEDPLLALAAGRRPEITDAATLRTRIGKGDAAAVRVVANLDSARYALVVLDRELAAERERWYRDFQFGAAAATALTERYRPVAIADGFFLYRPRVTTEPPPPAR